MHVEVGNQMEALEHEADRAAAYVRLVFVAARDSRGRRARSGPRRSRRAGPTQVQAGGLARARRSHDRDVFAAAPPAGRDRERCTSLISRAWRPSRCPAGRSAPPSTSEGSTSHENHPAAGRRSFRVVASRLVLRIRGEAQSRRGLYAGGCPPATSVSPRSEARSVETARSSRVPICAPSRSPGCPRAAQRSESPWSSRLREPCCDAQAEHPNRTARFSRVSRRSASTSTFAHVSRPPSRTRDAPGACTATTRGASVGPMRTP